MFDHLKVASCADLLTDGTSSPFWHDADLRLPQEPWVCQTEVRKGIAALLSRTRHKEELLRLKDELSKLLDWLQDRHLLLHALPAELSGYDTESGIAFEAKEDA